MCMKPTSFFLSMIILGKQMHENDIDVYLQPFMKESKESWIESVKNYDVLMCEMFKIQVALIWTISDFLELGTLSSLNTYIELGCPTYNFNIVVCLIVENGVFRGIVIFLDQIIGSS